MRKNFCLTLLLLVSACITHAQGNIFPAAGSAGIGTVSPNSSAILDMQSTTQGMLVPRMTKIQRDAIASPASGLMIYQTNSVPGFYYYTGTVWAAISVKGANTALSNLKSPTALNTDILPGLDNNISLGSATLKYRDMYLYNLKFSDGSTQTTAFNPYGTGNAIDITNNIITNTAPDQIVSITGEGAAVVSGTYPNFIVAAKITAGKGIDFTNNEITNTLPDQVVTLANGQGITVSGTYPNFTIGNSYVSSQWTTSGINSNNIFYTTGNVGIATNNPTAKLDVAGDIKVNGISFGRGGGNIPTNTALGRAALALNITGSFNVAVGDSALYNNNAGALFATQGVYNIAVGPKALFKHSFGAHNQAMGFQALYNNQSGVNNVAIGSNSLYTNTGNDNTAVGYNAAYSGALAYKNTAIGSNALLNNTGSNNTAVGYNADIFINWSNSTAIGYNAFCSGSNQVRIGDNNIVSIGGTVSWSNLSDARVKRNIRANIPGLSFINLLKPVTYTFDLDAVDKITKKPEIKDIQGKTLQPSKEDIKAKNEKERIIYSGFLAQQVEQAAKSIGYDFSGIDIPKNDKDAYGLRYAEFVVPLVKAVQELSMASDAKDKRIDELEAKLSRLEKLITPAPAAASLNQQPAGSLSIKPNPVSTALIVTGLNGKGFITILSADGIQLQRKQVSSTTLSMQVASLLPGTYFLQYADGQNIQAISFIRQ